MFFAPVKSRRGTKIWNMSVSKTTDYIQIKIKMSNSSQEPPASSKTWMFLATSKSREGTKIWDLGVSKTSDHIQIKIMIPNYSQVHPGSIVLQSPKLGHTGHGCSLHHQNQYRVKMWNTCVSNTSDHRRIKIFSG